MGLLSSLQDRYRRWSFDRAFNGALKERRDEIVDWFTHTSSSERHSVLEERDQGMAGLKTARAPWGKDYSKYQRKVSDLKDSLRSTRKTLSKMNSGIVLWSPYRYDLIDRFFSRESYFARSIARQFETMVRNGYRYIANDASQVRRIKQDLTFALGTNQSTLEQLFASLFLHLSKYSIVFIHKMRGYHRRKDNDGLKLPGKQIKRLRVIRPQFAAAHFDREGKFLGISERPYISPATETARGMGRARMYRPFMMNSTPHIPAEDLVVLRLQQEDDFFFPEPSAFQMFDDVLTLRSLEETVELLAFQFGSPLLHATVGSMEEPSNDAEIGRVLARIEAMASNGMIATDHRVKIDIKNLLGSIGDLMPYIEHFKNRVLVGSGSSTISVGEGSTANRNTADSIDNALADHCTFMGSIICNAFSNNIIPDILNSYGVEGGELYDENGDPAVRLEFNEMKVEIQAAREQSTISQYQNNLISFPEARRLLKHAPLSPNDEHDLFVHRVSIPLAQARIVSGDQDSALIRKTATQLRPQNQHGTKAGPGSVKK